MPTIRQFRGLPTEQINHEDLLNMPDVAGINPDHDARYPNKNAADTIGGIWTFVAHPLGIDHLQIANIGVNTHLLIDTHIADGTIHFTEASINHLNIQNIGTNSHVAIDTHITAYNAHDHSAADPTQVSHANLTNVTSDQHHAQSHNIASHDITATGAELDAHLALVNEHLDWTADQGATNINPANYTDTDTTAHASFSQLDYASAGHTGFAPALGADDNYVTDAEKAALHTQNTDTALGAGCVAADHGAAATDQVINVCYGTGDPPDPATMTEGALWVKYTA